MLQNDSPPGVGPIPIPAHITGVAREMFASIVAELARRNATAVIAKADLIERLAVELARIREVDPLLRFGYAIASAAESIKMQCWTVACEFAADLQLPQDELARLVWA